METNKEEKPRVVFGSRAQKEPVVAQTPSNPVDDGMPTWDEPPMDAYDVDNAPPSDNNWENSSPEEFGIPAEFEDQQPQLQTNMKKSTVSIVPDAKLEIYAYPRSVRTFNESIKFGMGIDYDLAKKIQQQELNNRRNAQNQNMNNRAPASAPTPASSQAQAPAPASAPAKAPTQNNSNRTSYQDVNKDNSNDSATPAPAKPTEANKPSHVSNNIAYLDSTPLLVLMEHFVNYYSKTMPLKHLYQNVFQMGDYKIRVNNEESKWYNIDTKRGHTNALSLARELIAIHDDLNLNDPDIFRSACSKAAKEINTLQRNIERYTDLNELIALTKASNGNNNGNQRKNSPEYMDKQYNADVEAKNKQTQDKPEMNQESWAAMRDHLNSISLRQIAEWLGATPGEDGNPNLWKFHTLSGNNIAITGQSFKNWNYSGNGGKGAINFMKQYISISENIPESEDDILYKKAFNALMKEFGNKEGLYVLDGESYQTAFCFPHILPGKTNEVKYYLNGERGLPMWIINKQISNGVLFAGFPSDWEPDKLLRESEKMKNSRVWATFLAPNGMAAEMRGIENNKPAKILAKGSEKNTGGYLVPAEKKYNEGVLAICEASVDATSYSSLYPGRSSTSVMGVNVDLAIELTFEADEKGLKSHINFDNDFAGNTATFQFHKKIQEQIDDDEQNSIYNDYLNSGKIKYFELGVQIFRESLKNGIPYYFDMNSKPEGVEAANLFLQTVFREMDREEVKNHLIKGRLKVNNVCPIWIDIKDVDLEAKTAVEFLKKNSRYYYFPEPIKPFEADPNEKKEFQDIKFKNYQETCEKREKFIEAFEKHAGPENLILWKMDKRIADNIEPIAKDWNEWMNYQIKNNKELKKDFADREIEFKHYEKQVQQMKPSDLGNNDKIRRPAP